MTQTFSTASLLHGGDYNPEQWLNQPEILEKDMEYFKKANINTVTLGVFSWAVLEPEEGRYEFGVARQAVDEAISKSFTLKDFDRQLSEMGYCINFDPNRKYWTIIGKGWQRP